MEGTGMVPSTAGNADEGSTPDSAEGITHPRTVSQRLSLNFSEGATKLLLVSWRQKSSKTYDSLF